MIIIPANLIKMTLLPLFGPFVETKTKNQIFNKLDVFQRKIFLFFVYMELAHDFKDMSNSVPVIPVRIIVS